MTIKYQVSKSNQSRRWKDMQAGWKYWDISFACQECGESANEHLHGTEDQIKDYCSHSVNETCEKCQSA